MKLFTLPRLLLVWVWVICSVCLICLGFWVFFNELLSTTQSIHCDFIWCGYLYVGSKKNVTSHPETQSWSIQSEIYDILKKKVTVLDCDIHLQNFLFSYSEKKKILPSLNWCHKRRTNACVKLSRAKENLLSIIK